MHYLVTGGTGFIGSYVVRDLLDAGHTVTAFDLAPNPEHMRVVVGGEAEGVEIVRGDVQDMALLLRTAQRVGAERIVHLAATLGAGSEENPVRTLSVNCGGTLNVFEVALAVEVEKVVWGSSIAVFGPTSERPPGGIANDAYHSPVRLYGACKSLLERFSAHYRAERDLDAVGLRFSIVYGFGKALSVTRGSRADHLIALIDAPALDQATVVPYGDDLENLLYVEDAARAIVMASDTPKNRSVGLTVCGTETTVRAAAETVQRILPHIDIRVEPGVRGGSAGYDTSVTEAEIGYAPAFSLEEGLRLNINMLRERHGLPAA